MQIWMRRRIWGSRRVEDSPKRLGRWLDEMEAVAMSIAICLLLWLCAAVAEMGSIRNIYVAVASNRCRPRQQERRVRLLPLCVAANDENISAEFSRFDLRAGSLVTWPTLTRQFAHVPGLVSRDPVSFYWRIGPLGSGGAVNQSDLIKILEKFF